MGNREARSKVTVEADEDGLDQSFGRKLSRTWRWTACGRWGGVGMGQDDDAQATFFPFTLLLSYLLSSQGK